MRKKVKDEAVKKENAKKKKVKEENKHVKKDAVKKAVKHEINIVTIATILNHMPKANSDVNVKPAHYGNHVIYTDLKKKRFQCRVYRNPNVYNTRFWFYFTNVYISNNVPTNLYPNIIWIYPRL